MAAIAGSTAFTVGSRAQGLYIYIYIYIYVHNVLYIYIYISIGGLSLATKPPREGFSVHDTRAIQLSSAAPVHAKVTQSATHEIQLSTGSAFLMLHVLIAELHWQRSLIFHCHACASVPIAVRNPTILENADVSGQGETPEAAISQCWLEIFARPRMCSPCM